jgi:hypothetical protein
MLETPKAFRYYKYMLRDLPIPPSIAGGDRIGKQIYYLPVINLKDVEGIISRKPLDI